MAIIADSVQLSVNCSCSTTYVQGFQNLCNTTLKMPKTNCTDQSKYGAQIGLEFVLLIIHFASYIHTNEFT